MIMQKHLYYVWKSYIKFSWQMVHCILNLLQCWCQIQCQIISILSAARQSDQDSMLWFVIPGIVGNTEHTIQVKILALISASLKTLAINSEWSLWLTYMYVAPTQHKPQHTPANEHPLWEVAFSLLEHTRN